MEGNSSPSWGKKENSWLISIHTRYEMFPTPYHCRRRDGWREKQKQKKTQNPKKAFLLLLMFFLLLLPFFFLFSLPPSLLFKETERAFILVRGLVVARGSASRGHLCGWEQGEWKQGSGEGAAGGRAGSVLLCLLFVHPWGGLAEFISSRWI